MASQVRNYDVRPDSRYLDHLFQQRTGVVLFDLLAKYNERNAQGMRLLEQGASAEDVLGQVDPSLLDRLNRILDRAHLELELLLTDQGTFDAVSTTQPGVRYPIFQMSDGEKSALLLAAHVLVAPQAVIQIIDEPERHLHRWISAGLIEAVMTERPDCHFVAITHDLEFSASLPRASTDLVVLSGCKWSGETVCGWELHTVDEGEPLPESARRAILGGRREILFIEGDAASADLSLYRLLFARSYVTPVGGCDQVIRSVTGLGDSGVHHWIDARGIVDGDGRTIAEKDALARKGILTLSVNEIENLYYTDVVIAAMAQQQGKVLGRAAGELRSDAAAGALAALRQPGTGKHLASALALAVVRRQVLEHLPDRDALSRGEEGITLRLESPFPAELAGFEKLLAVDNLEQIVCRYPIRDSGVRRAIANGLRFQNIDDYESAVRSRVRDDETLAQALRDLVGALPAARKDHQVA